MWHYVFKLSSQIIFDNLYFHLNKKYKLRNQLKTEESESPIFI